MNSVHFYVADSSSQQSDAKTCNGRKTPVTQSSSRTQAQGGAAICWNQLGGEGKKESTERWGQNKHYGWKETKDLVEHSQGKKEVHSPIMGVYFYRQKLFPMTLWCTFRSS